MIKIEALSKVYNKGKENSIKALDSVSLELGDKGLYVIYGKSGSGKSTLMDMIGGLASYDGGAINIDGTSYEHMVPDEYRIDNIGYIFQNYCLDPHQNVYDNVALGLRTIGVTDEEVIFNRVMTALAGVDMENFYKRDVDTLSGGEMQRVAIARAMAKGSKVILADEPTGNLDEYNTLLVLDILKEIAKTSLVILVTHEENIAAKYADKVIEIRDGKVHSETLGRLETGDIEHGGKVFLGDLPHKMSNIDGVNIELYGESEPCSIRLIHVDGKYYIDVDKDNVTYLREDSNLHIINDTSEHYNREVNNTRHIKLRQLEHITPSREREVFRYKDVLRESFRHNFGRHAKAGNKILNVAIVLLTLSIVLVAGFLGSALYNESRAPHDMLETSIYLSQGADSNGWEIGAFSDRGIGEYLANSDKIDSYYYTGYSPFVDIRMANFDTKIAGNQILARLLTKPKKNIANAKVIKGNITDSLNGIVVTTNVIITGLHNDIDVDSAIYDMVLGSAIVNENGAKLGEVEAIIESDAQEIYASDVMIESINMLYHEDLLLTDLYTDKAADDTIYMYDHVAAYSHLVEDCKIKLDSAGTKVLNVVYLDETLYPNVSETCYMNYLTFAKYRVELMQWFFRNPYLGVKIFTSETDSVISELNDIQRLTIENSNDSNSSVNTHLHDAVVTAAIELVVIYVLLMILTGILMYANFASSIKEVGIYRAIGVSKKSIIVKTLVESLSSTILVSFITLIVMAIILFSVGTGVLMSSIYLEWWLFLVMVVGVLGGMILFSILPGVAILRKTPREILARFDI